MDSALSLSLKQVYPKLPTYEFELLKDGKPVGLFQIRMKPGHSENVPAEMASNLYEEIQPQFRKQGYGRECLRLGLIEAKKLGLSEVSITCLKTNIGSQKIIEANGGVFIEERPLLDNSGVLLKYRIDLK